MNSFLANDGDSFKMPTELQDILLDRHRNIADWIALLKVDQRPAPLLFSDPGRATAFSDRHHHLRLVARSSSNSDPGAASSSSSWTDLELLGAAAATTADVGGRSGANRAAGKSERYKTELCRSFEETGFCKYKEKCQFAHGFQELRNVQRHPKYKTDLCRTYHSTGFCPYGSRCHFVHAELTTPTTTPTPTSGPSRPPLGTSELQADRDGRTKVERSLSSPDQKTGGISVERLDQYLDAFNRVLRAFSYCSSPSPPSPSPTTSSNNNFDVLARQDSVSSGSMRSTPDRLSSVAPSLAHDEKWNGYSRFSSCSNDNEVFGGGYGDVLQSPRSPTPPFGQNVPSRLSSSAGLSNFWARATALHHHHHHHPLSNLFSQTSN